MPPAGEVSTAEGAEGLGALGADDQKDQLEGLLAYLTGYAKELEEQAGAPDPEIREKIRLLQMTIQQRDAVVQQTVERIQAGGAEAMYHELNTMEQAVKTVEKATEDPSVLTFLSDTKEKWTGVVGGEDILNKDPEDVIPEEKVAELTLNPQP